MLLLVGGRSDTLQLEAGHRALGHGGALLQVLQNNVLRCFLQLIRGSDKIKPYLEHQLATRGPDHLPLVALCVVGQPPAVGDTLDHLEG